ncbi:MAG: hypothetical protein ABI451_08825, partial [Dokdonella sp.]
MSRRDLICRIQDHLNSSQKSERWAMYRLIVPVIDFANSTLRMRVYFEFNQTSMHGTSQSVDVALLDDDDAPRVMVEAKRVDRRIAAEQISKYLTPGVRGLVANGVHWVLCHDGMSKAVSVCRPVDELVAADALDEIVAFIRGEILSDSGWSTEQKYMDPVIRPQKLRKELSARRISNSVQAATDIDAMRSEVAGLSNASELEKRFLESMANQFEGQGGLPGHLRCEIRSSRVVFFDDRIPIGSQRVARMELGKKNPDILVLTRLAG